MLCWRDIVEIIAGGLKCIHKENLYHGNLHGGNILIEGRDDILDARITDIGLNFWTNNDQADISRSNKKMVFRVLPYVALEVLLGNHYADVYSFGIIMWTLASGIRPFSDIPHDEKLAYEIIINGKRPKINEEDFPKIFTDLMRKCWDNDPKKRPTAQRLFKIAGKWVSDICDNPNPTETSRQFDDAEDKKFQALEKKQFSQPTIHPLAFYISRPLDFSRFRSDGFYS